MWRPIILNSQKCDRTGAFRWNDLFSWQIMFDEDVCNSFAAQYQTVVGKQL
jgi:hypothetical protein